MKTTNLFLSQYNCEMTMKILKKSELYYSIPKMPKLSTNVNFTEHMVVCQWDVFLCKMIHKFWKKEDKNNLKGDIVEWSSQLGMDKKGTRYILI